MEEHKDAMLERLQEYYRFLFGRGEVTSRKDFAAKSGVSYHSMGQAFSGGKYLSTALMNKVRLSFPSLAELEQGPKTPEENVYSREVVERLVATVESQQRTIEMLVSGRVVAAQSQSQKNLEVENYGG